MSLMDSVDCLGLHPYDLAHPFQIGDEAAKNGAGTDPRWDAREAPTLEDQDLSFGVISPVLGAPVVRRWRWIRTIINVGPARLPHRAILGEGEDSLIARTGLPWHLESLNGTLAALRTHLQARRGV